MKQKVVYTFCFLVLSLSSMGLGVDRSEYYKALSSGSLSLIDAAIENVEAHNSSGVNNAFLGTLYMRKAAFIEGVKDKLAFFKKGMELLEAEIAEQPENAEYRFLRLSIQEHAPAMLGYNEKLEEDKQMVYTHFNSFSAVLQNAVKTYCAQSEVLDCAKL